VGLLVASVDKNKGCIDVLPSSGSDRSSNTTSNKSIACFWVNTVSSRRIVVMVIIVAL